MIRSDVSSASGCGNDIATGGSSTEALTISEERWSLVARATADGIWEWDLQADRMYLSPRWHEILGYEQRPGQEKPASWFDLVHEQDLPRLQGAIEAHLAGTTALLECEHRIRDSRGRWRWVLSRGLAIRDEHGVGGDAKGGAADQGAP